ncbi:MAG: DUF4286 family protein [Marinifilaceae bacterium]|jgi:hypothetical protein
MIIFNTTYHVDDSCEKEWIDWAKEKFIPLIMETGVFSQHIFCRILSEEQQGGKSFSLQLFVKKVEHFKRYQAEFAPKIQAVLHAKFANRILAFSTLLEEV